MGSLGDRIGLDLMDMFESGENPVQTDTSKNFDKESETSTVDNEGLVLEQALRTVIGDLNGTDPESIDLDASLNGEMDITGLAFWSVVAEMERDLGETFQDSDAICWSTPRDILNAAATVSKENRHCVQPGIDFRADH